MRNNGFLLVDVMVATMVLALMVGAVAGTLSAQSAARARAAARSDQARCFEEAVVLMTADPTLRAGRCGNIRWHVDNEGEKSVWRGALRHFNDLTLELPQR